jgi:ABC-type transporter Mla subunit MlaD
MARINTGVVAAAIDTLHGARRLPPEEAVEKLDSFLDALSAESDGKFIDSAKASLSKLVSSLREQGSATDDVWGQAIETMVSLSNNPD